MELQPVETLRPAADEADDLRRAQRENETLYAVIKTVSSSLDLDRVLGAIVEIATDATGCHAAFIYFLEGDRLSCGPPRRATRAFVGEARASGSRRGLPGWVARTKTPSSFPRTRWPIPRMKFVPELEEERFQSMVAVPILAKSGDVIGVAVLHTAAPREFDDEVLNFLVHTASLGRRRDRERPALRGDPAAGAGADDSHRAEPGAGRCDRP